MTDEPELDETADEMPVEETEIVDEQPVMEETSDSLEQPEVSVLLQVPETPAPQFEGAGQNASLNPDDVGADSDLVRPSRATQFRAQRRMQLSNTLPALLFIAAGVLLLLRPDAVTRLLVV